MTPSQINQCVELMSSVAPLLKVQFSDDVVVGLMRCLLSIYNIDSELARDFADKIGMRELLEKILISPAIAQTYFKMGGYGDMTFDDFLSAQFA